MEFNKIHSDSRGSIGILIGDFKKYPECTVFYTKAGYARGGCIHPKNDEFVCVIEGVIKYFFGIYMKYKTLKAGDTLNIPKNTPHYFVALKDSVVLEWGALPEEKINKHPETRRIVESINQRKDNG